MNNKTRQRIHDRIRKKINGTAECPRLNVYRSLVNIYAQVIDDKKGVTVVSASTLDESLKGKKFANKTDAAKAVGKLVAARALEAGIKQVVFDRGGYLYTGRVKELAEAARQEGLDF